MKKVTKPEQKEEAVYYSDFSGKCFGNLPSPITLKIEFGYGSIYDGSSLEFELDDDDIDSILVLLKNKLSIETKNCLKNTIKKLDKQYENSVEFRDWSSCDYLCNNKDLIKKII